METLVGKVWKTVFFVGKNGTNSSIAELYGFHDDVTTPRKDDTSLAVRLKLVFNTFLALAWPEEIMELPKYR